MARSELFVAVLLSFSLVYAQNQCYTAPQELAADGIIPCGSLDGSPTGCCQAGDICYADSTCWNSAGVTYLYGCTDSTYQHASCPWKCGPDFDVAPWVGIQKCYDADVPSQVWSCTHPPDNSSSVQENAPQDCDDGIIAFAGPVTLQPILSLPAESGGSTVWYSEVSPSTFVPQENYTPSTISTLVAASVPTKVEYVSSNAAKQSSSSAGIDSSVTSNLATPSSATTITPSSRPSETSSPNSGLSTGTKIGIAVAVIGLVLIATAIGLFVFMFRRRRSRSHYQRPSQNVDSPTYHDKLDPPTPYKAELHAQEKQPNRSELFSNDLPQSRPSELPSGGTLRGGSHTARSGFEDSSNLSSYGMSLPSSASEASSERPTHVNQVHELG